MLTPELMAVGFDASLIAALTTLGVYGFLAFWLVGSEVELICFEVEFELWVFEGAAIVVPKNIVKGFVDTAGVYLLDSEALHLILELFSKSVDEPFKELLLAFRIGT